MEPRKTSRIRPLMALAVASALVFAGSASAAGPSKSCALFSDPAGDARVTVSAPGGPSEDALDFTYVNLASDGKKVTGVFGLTKAATAAATAPNGYQLLLNFTVRGFTNEVYLNATGARGGMAFNFGQNDPTLGLDTLGAASGVVDTAYNEIRVTAKLTDLKAAGINLKPGMKLSGFNAVSSRDLVLVITFADRALGDKEYTVGAKSCFKVGK